MIIGICGIDGAGKSTLLSGLRSWPLLRDASWRKMPPGENYRRLLRFHPDLWADPAALPASHHGRAVGWADVFDFLHYYEDEIRPALDRGEVIVHDRWTPCFMAYCDCVMGLDGAAALRLQALPPADLILYLEVAPEVAYERIRRTRTPHPDEDPAILRAFRDGYGGALRAQTCPVVRISGLDAPGVLAAAKDSIEHLLGRALQDVVGDVGHGQS
jgi:thymidylate kinase